MHHDNFVRTAGNEEVEFVLKVGLNTGFTINVYFYFFAYDQGGESWVWLKAALRNPQIFLKFIFGPSKRAYHNFYNFIRCTWAALPYKIKINCDLICIFSLSC